jgi:hypothetical protein
MARIDGFAPRTTIADDGTFRLAGAAPVVAGFPGGMPVLHAAAPAEQGLRSLILDPVPYPGFLSGVGGLMSRRTGRAPLRKPTAGPTRC